MAKKTILKGPVVLTVGYLCGRIVISEEGESHSISGLTNIPPDNCRDKPLKGHFHISLVSKIVTVDLLRATAAEYEARHMKLQKAPEGTFSRCCNRVASLALDAVATRVERGI